MSMYTDLHKAYERCKYKVYTRDGRPISCRNPYCPNSLCRRKCAEKHSVINQPSAREKSPNITIVLRVEDELPLSLDILNHYLSKRFERFKYFRKSTCLRLEYESFVHFKNKRPHVHLTLIAPDFWKVTEAKAKIKEWWKKSCDGRKVSVYAARIRDVVANIKYITGDVKNRSKYERPCQAENGKRGRLIRRSNGFLVRPARILWKEHIAELFPKPNARDTTYDSGFIQIADGSDMEPIEF